MATVCNRRGAAQVTGVVVHAAVELESRLIELKRRTFRKLKCLVVARGLDSTRVARTKAVAPQRFLS
jgi:hypothetical protein